MAIVKDIIGDKGNLVNSVEKSDNVLNAAKLMNERRIGSLVVTEGDKVIGIFTERDILVRVVAAQRDPAKTTIQEVMTTPVACCKLTTPVEEVTAVMTNKRIRHIPVVEDQKLIGIVTSGDILAHRESKHQETIEYLHQYIRGDYR